ncbi:hypothetical protein N9M83_03975 [Candidatus Poseidonia alphae]|nr:hypothetical protein [Candidatus Poseidonia alphae]
MPENFRRHVGHMRTASFIIFILVATMVLPFVSPTVQAADEEDDVIVCCEASTVELYLLGSDSNKQLTPFFAELSTESQTVSMRNSIQSQETIGKWTLSNSWGGEVPSSTWSFSMEYEVSGAAGATINATASIAIGSKSYSAQTEPNGAFLNQGKGSLDFSIDVDESFTLAESSTIVLELKAQTLIFSFPEGTDAEIKFLWGGEEDPSSIEGTLPLLDIMMPEPEVEGSDVYLAVKLDSPWGLSTLALAESISLNVNGAEVTGDPIETASGDTVRVTWTWSKAIGGIESINVEVSLKFQPEQPALKGSTTFEIETFDTDSGTGTYYPPDEPLRTNGDGSSLVVDIQMELSKDGDTLLLRKVTTLTIGDEMAFWMRWGMDHIGDENPALSSTLRAFSEGAVSEEDRVSRLIEETEIGEFERQMVSLGPMYLAGGLGIQAEDLLGTFREFSSLKVDLDLNGENAVVNHPVTLRFSTTEVVAEGTQVDLINRFIVVQPAPLWSSFSLSLTAKTSSFTSLSNNVLRESTEFQLSVLRMPWGDEITLEGEGISQEEAFRLNSVPTSAVSFTPMPLTLLSVFGLLGAFMMGMRITRQRKRTVMYSELVLVPVVGLVLVLGYPAIFVGGAVIASSLIWWVTAIASPRLSPRNARKPQNSYPVIPCPACQVSNPVTSTERPHRFACAGCERVIRLEA